MISRYIGDRIVQDFITGQPPFPTNLLSGAILNTIEPKSFFVYDGNAWAPVNHFYVGSGIAGFTTGITLENQSNTGAFGDWEDLTTMSASGDWGTLDSPTSSGDWGSILDSITPGTSIDVKLAEDRRTVAAIRFRRLVSGNSNYDSTVEFWCHDSGALVPRFYIQSGLFLPWLSGKQFLGLPFLPFSGIFTEKLISKQIQIENGIIPSSGNTLSATSGQLYWSGQKAAIISGNTENAVLVYNEDYPNAIAQTGVYVNQGKLAVGISTLPDYNLQVHGSAPSVGITSLTNTAELSMTNAIQNKCYLVYSGSGFDTRVGSATLPTTTVRHGELDVSGLLRIRGNDNRSYENALSTISGQLYWSGSKIAILSGNTANGLIKYDANYPNAAVQTGAVHIYDTALGGDTFGIGTSLPSYNLETKASNASLGVTSTSTSAEIDMVNTVGNKCYFVYSGQKLDMRIGSVSIPTITIVGGSPGNIGFRTNEPRGDLELLRNSISVTQNDTYGISLRNDTASTSSSNQYSPPLIWRGSFRNPTGLNSLSSEFRSYISTSSGDNPLVSGSGALVFEGQVNSSGYKELIRLDYDAGLKLASNRTFNSGIVFADHRGGLMEASGMSFDTGTNVLKIKTISGNQARYHVGGTLYSNPIVVPATDDVTNLMSYALPGNTLLNVGDRIDIHAAGYFNDASAPARLILEAFNTKIIDVSTKSFLDWTIKTSLYMKAASKTINYDYIFYTGNATDVKTIMVTTPSDVSGNGANNTNIVIRGQSGMAINRMFIDFLPANA